MGFVCYLIKFMDEPLGYLVVVYIPLKWGKFTIFFFLKLGYIYIACLSGIVYCSRYQWFIFLRSSAMCSSCDKIKMRSVYCLTGWILAYFLCLLLTCGLDENIRRLNVFKLPQSISRGSAHESLRMRKQDGERKTFHDRHRRDYKGGVFIGRGKYDSYNGHHSRDYDRLEYSSCFSPLFW